MALQGFPYLKVNGPVFTTKVNLRRNDQFVFCLVCGYHFFFTYDQTRKLEHRHIFLCSKKVKRVKLFVICQCVYLYKKLFFVDFREREEERESEKHR